MNRIITVLFWIIQVLWELPQNILGAIVYVAFWIRSGIIKTDCEKGRLFIETRSTGVSLGFFIFWTPSGNRFKHYINDCRMHETGHAIQSKLLGPFYLLIIGLPSFTRAVYSRYYYRKYGMQWENYFNAFPENWADKLGGILRKQ